MPANPESIDLSVEMRRPRNSVFSIGSNLGDRLEYLTMAVRALRATPGLRLRSVSSVYATAPVGVLTQPDFLNAVVMCESTLPSMVMLERALAIEDALNRVRTTRWGPRTIDVDLITVGDRQLDSPDLALPHPRAHERAFVLVPWLEVQPDAVLVGRGPIAGLVAGLDTSGVRRLDAERIDW